MRSVPPGATRVPGLAGSSPFRVGYAPRLCLDRRTRKLPAPAAITNLQRARWRHHSAGVRSLILIWTRHRLRRCRDGIVNLRGGV